MKLKSILIISLIAISQAGFAKAKVSGNVSGDESAKMADAIQKLDRTQVEALKKKGVSLNALGADGLNGLMRLSDDGNSKGIEQALQMGSDLNAANQDGETALFYATYSGHEQVALDLLKRGAKADIVLKKNNECALHSAAKASLLKLSKELKKLAPRCLKIKNSDGQTPSQIAKDMGSPELAKVLKP